MSSSIFPDTPEFRQALADVDAEFARSVDQVCPWPSRCRIVYDPMTRRQVVGFGAVGCPCGSLPGRHNSHVDQLPKPAWAHRVRGRHGSRAARSRRRHRGVGQTGLMAWAERQQPTRPHQAATAQGEQP